MTLYRWKTSEGYKWKKFGEDEIHEKYQGEVNWRRIPDGVGKLSYLNGDKDIGEFEDGLRHGLGTYIWYRHND